MEEQVKTIEDIQALFAKANLIYKITKDIDLGGGTLTIPAGCTLDFQGGSFSNGTITGTKTSIISRINKIFDNIILSGTWDIDEAYPQWGGAKGDGNNDDTSAIQMFLDVRIPLYFPRGTYKTTEPLRVKSNCILRGENVYSTIINKSTDTISDFNDYSNSPSGSGSTSLNRNSVITILDYEGYSQDIIIENIQINRDLALYTGWGSDSGKIYSGINIFAPYVHHLKLEKVKTSNSGRGFYSLDCWMSTFYNCQFDRNKDSGFTVERGTSLSIISSWVTNCFNYGWYITASYSNLISCGADYIGYTINGSDASIMPNHATAVYKLSGGINLVGCGCELVRGTVFDIAPNSVVSIISFTGNPINYDIGTTPLKDTVYMIKIGTSDTVTKVNIINGALTTEISNQVKFANFGSNAKLVCENVSYNSTYNYDSTDNSFALLRIDNNKIITIPSYDGGTTSNRNILYFNPELVGKTYFDTDLNKLIVWNGSAWVNMDGTALE